MPRERTSAYTIAQGIQNILGLTQMAGNLLSLPNTIQNQTQQAQTEQGVIDKMFPQGAGLEGGGLGKMVAPTPGLQFLNPSSYGGPGSGMLSGTAGKLLSGIGDVGQILGSITGGQGSSKPGMDLQTLTALANLQRRDADEKPAGYWTQQLAMEDRRTKADEDRAAADVTRANKAGGSSSAADKWRELEQAKQRERMAHVDELGITDPTDRAKYIQTGKIPPGAKKLTFDTFYKTELGRKVNPLDPASDYQAPEVAAARAHKAYQQYLTETAAITREQDKAKKSDKVWDMQVDPTKYSPAGQLASQRIIALTNAGKMAPDVAARKLKAIDARETALAATGGTPGVAAPTQ